MPGRRRRRLSLDSVAHHDVAQRAQRGCLDFNRGVQTQFYERPADTNFDHGLHVVYTLGPCVYSAQGCKEQCQLLA